MTSGDNTNRIGLRKRTGFAVAGCLLLFCSVTAIAQESRPAANPPAQEAAPPHKPGMLDSMGRWFKESFGLINKNVEGARDSLGNFRERAGGVARDATDAAKDAATAAREAAAAVAKLPTARVVDGHERCVTAENGAPDCAKAAEAVCKAKGYGSGSSLEIQSAQKCSARAWLSGRQDTSACELQSFVIRAMCQ